MFRPLPAASVLSALALALALLAISAVSGPGPVSAQPVDDTGSTTTQAPTSPTTTAASGATTSPPLSSTAPEAATATTASPVEGARDDTTGDDTTGDDAAGDGDDGGGSARSTPLSAGSTAASEIQVLRTAETDDGRVTLELAIPPSIGELAPVAENFGVLAGGELLDFDVAPLTTGVDVVVVIDTSGSMRGGALDAAKQAASRFVQSLPDGATVGVVSFGQEVTVHRGPGLDRAGAVADINGLSSAGETALWDGLVAASELAGRSGTSKPYLVLLSDGDDTVSRATRRDAVDALTGSDVSLYAIAIESPDADGAALDGIVSIVGGNLVVTTGADELDGLYQEISRRLDSRYELSFLPSEGGRSDIAISVAAGSAIATARTGIGSAPAGDDAPAPAGPALDAAAEPAAPGDGGTGDEGSGEGVPVDPGDGGSTETALGPVAVTPTPGPLGQRIMYPVGLVTVFVSLLILGYLMAGQTARVTVGTASSADRMAGINTRMTGAVEQWLVRNDKNGRVELALDTAGIHLRTGEFVLLGAVVVGAATLLVGTATGPTIGVMAGLVAAVAVYLVVSIKISRRRNAFAEQLTGTLTVMIGALRAGHGMHQAIDLVSREAASPTSDQFRRVMFETRVGRDTTEAMMDVATRMESRDFEWVARAVAINRELGGDLTELLENVTDTIRDRRRVARMVRSLTAEGRMSGWVLIVLPIAMFLFTSWQTPENTRILLEAGMGRLMLGLAVVGMLVGFFWIRRLVDVKY